MTANVQNKINDRLNISIHAFDMYNTRVILSTTHQCGIHDVRNNNIL